MKINQLQSASDQAVLVQTCQHESTTDQCFSPVQGESYTRSQIFHYLLNEGALTATTIAQRLGLASVGVRRHLDSMVQSGHAQIVTRKKTDTPKPQSGEHTQSADSISSAHPTRPRSTSSRHTVSKGMRGRPAKYYELTALGRKQLGSADSGLAAQALAALRKVGGQKVIDTFAQERVHQILQSGELCSCGSVKEKADELGKTLTRHGYAASVREVNHGIEICQHNCPIADTAEQFPELCEGEHKVFSDYFDRPIQRLATIASGNRVCTTFIPLHAMYHPGR